MASRPPRERAARTAPEKPKRPWWLIAVGLAAALGIALATLPAKILAGQLTRLGLESGGLAGTVWSGHARNLAWRSAPLGDVHWSFTPRDLLRGRIGVNLQLTRLDGSATTHLSVGPGGELRLADTQANLPVEMLSALPLGMPRNWRGRLSGQFEEIVLAGGWPTTLRGTLDMDGLIAPPPRNISIGSYRVVMPDPQATGTTAGQLTARVTDKEGPFSFDGRFTLGADRSFLLEGSLAPRGNTPPSLVRSLQLLGPPDANGRRPVSVSGTL
jgi:general secretion pathway protein N